MIRKLQKRFILITVLALTVAMVLVVAVVNIANLISVRAELASTLSLLAMNDMPAVPPDNLPDNLPDADSSSGSLPDTSSENSFREDNSSGEKKADSSADPESSRFNDGRFGRGGMPQEHNRHTRNMISESSWFAAYLNPDESIRTMNLQNIQDLEEENAASIASQAIASGHETGYIGDYLFLVQKSHVPSPKVVVLDCETRLASVRNLALISGIACLGGILLALLLVSLLSRRAVQPTIRNMEQQKQFITNASHELKTPLTVISTNMELINMETPGNPWVRSTQKQAAAMARLVDELVYLSRMEEEHPAMTMESVDLSSLLEETAEPFEAMAEFNGRDMTVRTEKNLRVTGDRPSLQRLISTLCDNAAKYAPAGGSILAETLSEGRNAVLRLSNTVEAPLSKEQCAQLFNRFYRTDPSRNKDRQKGFGIGLSIAAAIAEKHNGTIRAFMEQDRLVIACSLPKEK